VLHSQINDYFSAAKRAVLSNANKLLADMQSFDKDNIPDKVIKAIDPFMADPDFEPKQIEKASKVNAYAYASGSAPFGSCTCSFTLTTQCAVLL
jgi:Microtubule-binding stalk of dynein motor